MKNNWYKQNFYSGKNKNTLYNSQNCNLPLSLFNKLKRLSEEKQIPVSRLVSYSVFNELETGDFLIDIPESKYENITDWEDDEKVEKTRRVINYIDKFGHNGEGFDYLVMSKMELGMSALDIIHSIQMGLYIEELSLFYPENAKGNWYKDYRRVAVTKHLKKQMEENQKRKKNGKDTENPNE